MSKKWLSRLIQAAMVAATVAAVFQEMEKPREQRKWHGKVGIVPYDFRVPTFERIRDAYWNPADPRILTPEPFGVGWAVNLPTLLLKLGVTGYEDDRSEKDFLMPTPSIKEVLGHLPANSKGEVE